MSAPAAESRQVVLTRYPTGALDGSCFALEPRSVVPPGAGEVLVRAIYLSCDPYLRLEITPRRHVAPGEPLISRVLGEVVASADAAWRPGDLVWGFMAWEEMPVAPAAALHRIDPVAGPISHAITVRGMNGLTAWAGMVEVGRPVPGSTVVVSAGTGSVGSVAGQLARLCGARTVAVVGGERKARHAVEHLGYDAVVDRLGEVPLAEALLAACPDGVDVFFDNVGGAVLEAVARRLRPHARIVVCGAVSEYDDEAPTPPDLRVLTGSGATATWLNVYHHLDGLAAFEATMGRLVAEGRVVFYEDVVSGIEHAADALLGVFRGENVGKRLVQVGPLPGAPAAG